MAGNLRIFSLNTRGLRNRLKRNAIFQLCKQQKYDVICLQETYITAKDVELWKKQWGGKMFHRCGTTHSRGELILVSKHIQNNVKLEINQDRVLGVSIELNSRDYVILNMYAPNNNIEKAHYFRTIKHTLKDYSEKDIILLGDFNCVLSNELDNISGQPHCTQQIKAFKEMISENALIDLWRNFHGETKEYTWCRQNPFIARRLDYCFVTQEIEQKCSSCDIISVANSDHRALLIEINDTEFVRGPGYWRFNNRYLEDTQFVNKMSELLKVWIDDSKSSFGNVRDQWDWCKFKIKDYCSEYGKFRAQGKRNNILDLQNKLQNLEKSLAKEPDSEHIHKEVLQTKRKLEIMSLEKARGAQIRARTKWVEEGEKNTKFFLGLEKNRAKQNTMTHLVKENGEIVTRQADVLHEQVNFYSALYAIPDEEENTMIEKTRQFMNNEDFPKLDERESASCEGLMNETEIGNALRKMKNGSAPGNDGLTVEFYKFFWASLSTIITDSFNEAFSEGGLSFSQKQGTIILLHKGKDLCRGKLNNWRPITLTNSDYKILAKALSLRLNVVIGKLINQDQVGYLKGRNISTIIRTVDDVINYLNVTKKGGYLLALDYQKAFDSISKTFMIQAFDIFGFGPQFKRWISVMITNTSSRINHGGWISESFPVHRGIRQGCPFSPLAFIVAVELLAIKIRNSNISGISLPSSEKDPSSAKLKVKQLADDTTLFLNDSQDMLKAHDILNDFSRISGLNLNTHKTKAMKLGTQKEEHNLPFELTDSIKILGIYFKPNQAASNLEENWTRRIDAMHKTINIWSKRDIGIFGKIVIIKSFIVSQFVFVMQSIGIPEQVLTTINKTLYKFVWQRKTSNRKAFEKVKRKVMEADINQGGVNMINIFNLQKSFYLQWVGKLKTSQNYENWTFIPKWHLNNIASGTQAFDINCSSKALSPNSNIKSPFWQEVLHNHLNSKTIMKEKDVRKERYQEQMLWNNSMIRYKGKVLFFPTWKRAGIEQMQDLIVEHEKRMMSYEEILGKLEQNKAGIIFEYNALINAIPKIWKEWIKEQSYREELHHDDFDFDYTIYCSKPTAILKMINCKQNVIKCCAEGFWLRNQNYQIDFETWLTPHHVTKEIRLRELQWKLIHNIYPTNILLRKMDVVDNNKCSNCRNEIDYVEHFFFYCPPVQKFWKKLESYVHGQTGILFKFNLTDILFGVKKTSHTTDFVNHVILIGKMCISIQKKTNSKTPIFIIFEDQLKPRKKSLKLI